MKQTKPITIEEFCDKEILIIELRRGTNINRKEEIWTARLRKCELIKEDNRIYPLLGQGPTHEAAISDMVKQMLGKRIIDRLAGGYREIQVPNLKTS